MVRIIQPLLNQVEEAALENILDYLSDEVSEYLQLNPDERANHIYRSVLALRATFVVGRPLFELGRIVSTPGALESIEKAKQHVSDFLGRHESGDWGDVCRDDWQANDSALEDGYRIFSVYRTNCGEHIWVITVADRSLTTLVLPDEY